MAMEHGREHSSCGVGLVAARQGQRNHAIVRSALHALRRVEHRGAVGPDGRSSDVAVPPRLREGAWPAG